MAEAGRVEIRGAHLAIVAFPRSQAYADSITLQFRRLSLQKKGNYVKIVCIVRCPATVPRSIQLSSSRVYDSSYKLSLFIRAIHEKLFRQLCSRWSLGKQFRLYATHMHALLFFSCLYCSCSPRLIDETQNHLPESARDRTRRIYKSDRTRYNDYPFYTLYKELDLPIDHAIYVYSPEATEFNFLNFKWIMKAARYDGSYRVLL